MLEPITAIVTDAVRTALLDFARENWDFGRDGPKVGMCVELEGAVRTAVREARTLDGGDRFAAVD